MARRILLLIAALSLAVFTASAAKPRKIVVEPLGMKYADSTRTERPTSKDPTVIRIGDYYYMYHTVFGFSKNKLPAGYEPSRTGIHSGIARSKDLIHWENLGDLDLQDSKGNPIGRCVAPCVKVFDGVIHMFYQRRWEKADNNNSCIWHAVSKDGITFTNTCDEPVIVPKTKWSLMRAIDAEVYRVGKKMIMMFATRDPENKVQMLGMAEAPYGSDYGPDKWKMLTTDAPFMKPDFEWEGHCIEAPTVIKEKGIWYLFYAGSYNHERQQIGACWSRDGRHFKRIEPEGLVFPHGPKGSWDEWERGHPGVFRDDDGQVYLFFQGKATRKGNYWLSVARVRFE